MSKTRQDRARHRPSRRAAEQRRSRSWGAYDRRNQALAEMGFPSYAAYLESELWRKIRLRVLRRDFFRCRFCGGKPRKVCAHHGDYERDTLEGLRLSGIYTACYRCHEELEFSARGGKLPPKTVRKKTRRLAKDQAFRERMAERRSAPLQPPSTGTDDELEAAGAAIRAAIAAGVF